MTTVDHAVVPELIRTHKVDIERGRLLRSPIILPALPRVPVVTAMPWPRCCFVGKTATESDAVILWILGGSKSYIRAKANRAAGKRFTMRAMSDSAQP
jgi:hypothetical protein